LNPDIACVEKNDLKFTVHKEIALEMHSGASQHVK